MIIVTGAAGFIGSNLVKALNERGRTDIMAVDDMTDGHKFRNLADLTILDYDDKDDFLDIIENDGVDWSTVDVVFHQGACSETTEWDGQYMMQTNHAYSRALLHECLENNVPFIYASSAAVYGANTSFTEDAENEKPLNVYGYSKLAFDQHVRYVARNRDSQVVGLRYFNVYGPREQHKESMASVAYHQFCQLQQGDTVKLFGAADGCEAGEQKRDFIDVADVVAVNLWFWDNAEASGIFNCGTGNAQTFNDVANAVIAGVGRGSIEYVDFPEHLKGAYQSYTQADLTRLREVGCDHEFRSVETGVAEYMTWLAENGS